MIGGTKGMKSRLASNINLPNSSELHVREESDWHRRKICFLFQDFKKICEELNDEDTPSLFGLPANIERSAQRMNSAQVNDE